MPNTLTMARREIAACFFSPMAYVIGALFLLASGLLFFKGFSFGGRAYVDPIFLPGSEASLRPLFGVIAALMVFATPLLTMRLISEELRIGTIETLMTAPVTDAQVIGGKFLGVMVFYLALLGGTLVHLGLLAAYGAPDVGVVLMGYLGLILLGAMFLSVGLFASTLTRYQILSAVVALAILCLFTFLADVLVVHLSAPWNQAAAAINALAYLDDFSKGIFNTRAVVFFVSLTGLFLFVSTKTLESRRWR